MVITTIVVADVTNPIEVQDWFNENPDKTMSTVKVFLQNNVFYLIYEN